MCETTESGVVPWWFLDRLQSLEERMRTSEQEIAQLKHERVVLLDRLGEGNQGSAAAAEETVVESRLERSGHSLDLTDELEGGANQAEEAEEEGNSQGTKWNIPLEMTELVDDNGTCSMDSQELPMECDRLAKGSLSMLVSTSSAPSNLCSWDAIIEKDQSRTKQISKLNTKYRWFVRAAEEFAERMVKNQKKRGPHRESHKRFSSFDDADRNARCWVPKESGRPADIPCTSAKTLSSTQNTRIFKKTESKQQKSSQQDKCFKDVDGAQPCRMKFLADRFCVHWNATFASATLITESVKASNNTFLPPKWKSLEVTRKEGNGQRAPFAADCPSLTVEEKASSAPVYYKSMTDMAKKKLSKKEFLTRASVDSNAFDKKAKLRSKRI